MPPTKVSALPLAFILAAVFSAGGALALAADTREKASTHDARLHTLEVDSALNTAQHQAILDALKEMKTDLKEIKKAVK